AHPSPALRPASPELSPLAALARAAAIGPRRVRLRAGLTFISAQRSPACPVCPARRGGGSRPHVLPSAHAHPAIPIPSISLACSCARGWLDRRAVVIGIQKGSAIGAQKGNTGRGDERHFP